MSPGQGGCKEARSLPHSQDQPTELEDGAQLRSSPCSYLERGLSHHEALRERLRQLAQAPCSVAAGREAVDHILCLAGRGQSFPGSNHSLSPSWLQAQRTA